ncbi:MAG: hypothetical protein KA371_17815 [Acidobacteria bacterium]|nr:hypothetical protein [Acidobacteriota bacterium]
MPPTAPSVAAALVLALLGAGDAAARQPTPAAAAAPQCSRTWTGREAAVEQQLATGVVTRMEAVPIGVTKPQRGYFAPGGLVDRFAWKALPPMRRGGFSESYKAEIAAYHLDRLLGMDMVPPVVERTIEGKVGAAVLWIEGTTGWNNDRPAQGPEPAWSRQVSRMKLFDQLIANIDRNQGNLLYDGDWHLFLIDHSRAFTARTSASGIAAINTVDRTLWQRIDALTALDMERALGAWLTADEQKALLSRRDLMRRAIEKLVRQKGAEHVFLE